MLIRLSQNQVKAQEVINERNIEKDQEAKVSIKKVIIQKKINRTNQRKRNNRPLYYYCSLMNKISFNTYYN